MADDIRPRFGQIIRKDGLTQPLVFHPTDTPNEFVALSAFDESELTIGEGDTMKVDALGPGQSVIFRKGDEKFSKPNNARVPGPTKEEVPMSDEALKHMEEKKRRDTWQAVGSVIGIIGILTLPAVVAVIYVAAVRFIW